jgi:SAM-dependent methyltransferase
VLRDGDVHLGALLRAEQPWSDAQLASWYDAFVFQADIPLYVGLARAQGQRVLEVACGSGRVLLPLARAGFLAVGIDISPHMLAITRSKLNGHEAVRLVEADMRAFALDDETPFDLAILAVKSFAYLTERADQLRCLQAIARHLRPGGLLAIDFLHPGPEWISARPGELRDDLLAHVPEQGFTLSRVESVVSTDFARQVRVIRSAYEMIDDRGAVVVRRFVEWPYRWTYRFEAEHLLERAGFEIEAVYGGYEREPFGSSSPIMLFVARKPATRL